MEVHLPNEIKVGKLFKIRNNEQKVFGGILTITAKNRTNRLVIILLGIPVRSRRDVDFTLAASY